jgi:hypothetical protein
MNNNNQLGLISTIAGVVALVLAVIGLIGGFWFKGGWLALFAIILGVIAIVLASSSKKNGGSGTAGLVTGIIAIVFGAIVGIACIICTCSGYYAALDFASDLSNYYDWY